MNSPTDLEETSCDPKRDHGGDPYRDPMLRWTGLPVWKKSLVTISVVLMLVGALLNGYRYVREPSIGRGSSTSQTVADQGLLSARQLQPSSTFSDSGKGKDDLSPHQSGGLAVWSPAVFRVGFGFFAGFCVGYATKIFLRIVVVSTGIVLLVLLGLQYGGLIDVNWTVMGSHYDAFTEWLGRQTTTFQMFVTGHIPSSAMAILGLVVGFKGRK